MANVKTSPFKSFIQKLFTLRKKYQEEGNTVASDLIKLLMNSLCGKTIQKDIDREIFIWKTSTLQRNYDDKIISRY